MAQAEDIQINDINKAAYISEEAIEKYSTYQLYPIEKYLFSKYYKKGNSVLDLACGGGRTTVRLYELGMNVRGSDISEPLIMMAKKRFPYISFEIGSYCEINSADGEADHVLISHNGIDYAYPEADRIRALKESVRVLKKGGTLILSSHNIKSLHFSPYYFLHWKRILWKLANTFNAFKCHAYVWDLSMYTFFGSVDYVKNQVEEMGMVCVEVVGFGLSRNPLFNIFISPYVHYVFEKR
jgi:ubiquinone/menaquinone biosynthesis C-methylase UbiE